MSLKRSLLGFLTVLIALVMGVSTQAALLSDLIANNGTVQNGDKLFSDFTYVATGQNPPSDRVNVDPIVDGQGNLGIRISGGFLDLDDNGASDALITFRVRVTDPRYLINDVHLAFNGDILGPPGTPGLVGITETFLPTDPNTQLSVFQLQPSGATQLTDWADLSQPVSELWVQKDIILFAGAGAAATISFIDQTFSQIQVPEPTSLALMGLGLLLLRGRRK